MAHPVSKLTQPRAFGAITGRRYGSFALKAGDLGGVISIPLVFDMRVALTVSPSLSTSIPLVFDLQVRLSMPAGNVKTVMPKS